MVAILLTVMSFTAMGCGAYYNTFFNAKKAFDNAERSRRDSARGIGNTGQYRIAIEKALKVVERYPNSKYYDDALYVLGVSYFHTRQFGRAERRFRELLIEFEDSEFVEESRLYLAKTKLELGDVADAMELFEEMFGSDEKTKSKGEAAMALGTYYYEQRENEIARDYLQAVRDSLGTADDRLYAQMLIADGQYEDFRFADALGSYLQVLGMTPAKDDLYHSLFFAADCSYQLQRTEDGFDYLGRLMDDERFYDSLDGLRMKVAEGYELDEDLEQAEQLYTEVAENSDNKVRQAQAYYRLGLLYQFDYDLLDEAKEYYDKAIESNRRASISGDAIQRSADIGKRESLAHSSVDSTTTLEEIDNLAETQYLLAELYWFQLDKRDTAMMEMQYLVDSFPDASITPKAMIALSQMYRDERDDSRTADSLLRAVVSHHRKSDDVGEAITLLGLSGTSADTGYASYHLARAEYFLVDEEIIDSARYHYQAIVDGFPDSKHYLQARFNLIWLTENYENPGDSTVLYAYEEFVDSFGGTTIGREAQRILAGGGIIRQIETQPDERDDLPGLADAGDGDNSILDNERAIASGENISNPFDSTDAYIDPLEAIFISPDFPNDRTKTIPNLDSKPIEVTRPFVYPTEALNIREEETFLMYFQVLVDNWGKVIKTILKSPSGVEELDNRAINAVETMTFSNLEMNRIISRYLSQPDTSGRGHWFVYKFEVKKPETQR